MIINEGDAFIEGRSPEKARELLAKAEAAGIDPGLVRTTSGGYLVPEEIAGEGAFTKSVGSLTTQADLIEAEKVETVQNEWKDREDEESAHPVQAATAGITPVHRDVDPLENAPEPVVEATEEEETEGEAQFDPSEHNIAEVEKHLAAADDTERERVLAAEREGKARKSLLSDDEGEK